MELNNTLKDKIFEAHLFWHKKRLTFNILVGIAGAVGLVFSWLEFFPERPTALFAISGSVLWGVVANGLYSLGFALDSLIIHQSKGIKSLSKSRSFLFGLGVLLYMLSSIAYPLLLGLTGPTD
jgi:hypothetical protein